MKKNSIILATHNRHKVAELLAVLADFPVEIKTLADFPAIGDIPETGKTLKENSLIKARTAHSQTGLPAIADDTGLEVDALKGAPGIYSARYAGNHASYADNVNKLLADLSGIDGDDRTARFRTVISYVDAFRELSAEGSIQGNILYQARGTGGFGYDPVFFVPKTGKTFAEMTDKEKNSISHRALAMQALKDQLAALVFNQS